MNKKIFLFFKLSFLILNNNYKVESSSNKEERIFLEFPGGIIIIDEEDKIIYIEIEKGVLENNKKIHNALEYLQNYYNSFKVFMVSDDISICADFIKKYSKSINALTEKSKILYIIPENNNNSCENISSIYNNIKNDCIILLQLPEDTTLDEYIEIENYIQEKKFTTFLPVNFFSMDFSNESTIFFRQGYIYVNTDVINDRMESDLDILIKKMSSKHNVVFYSHKSDTLKNCLIFFEKYIDKIRLLLEKNENIRINCKKEEQILSDVMDDFVNNLKKLLEGTTYILYIK
jgi:hypothetical protein